MILDLCNADNINNPDYQDEVKASLENLKNLASAISQKINIDLEANTKEKQVFDPHETRKQLSIILENLSTLSGISDSEKAVFKQFQTIMMTEHYGNKPPDSSFSKIAENAHTILDNNPDLSDNMANFCRAIEKLGDDQTSQKAEAFKLIETLYTKIINASQLEQMASKEKSNHPKQM